MKNNFYLLIGENVDSINFYKTDILKKMNVSDSIIPYDLSIQPVSDLLDEISMPSLFSNSKVIVATNFDISKISSKEAEYFNRFLASSPKDIYLLLIAKKADARLAAYKIFKEYFTIIDTNKDNGKIDVLSYTKELIDAKKYQISPSTLKYFLEKTGNNIYNIENELTKLFIYKKKDKVITNTDIDDVIVDNIDDVMYEFTNAILDNDINTITKMYNNFKLENIPFDYLLVTVSNTFRQALTIKLLLNDGKTEADIAKIIGRQAYFVKKMTERLYNYTDSDLAKYISKLAMIDNNFKSGKSTIDELELFLIDKEHYNS